jgi:undecaprenyl-diphosphatase
VTFIKSLIDFDNSVFIAVNSTHTSFFDIFFQIYTYFGTGIVIAPVLLAIIFHTIPPKQRKRIILCGIVSIGVSGIVNQTVKQIVHRPRPLKYFIADSQVQQRQNVDRPIYTVHILGPHLKYNSFPSGHSNAAFATATFLVLLYGRWFWCTYLLASLVAYSRMYLGVHFFLDTMGGAIIGVLIVSITFKLFRIERPLKDNGVLHDT